MISTRNLAALPDANRLKAALQAMAVLDAVLQPEWEYRLYSFNTRWGAGKELGSMRGGQGDDLFALFNTAGCWLKGFAHNAPMTPYRRNPKRMWPGVLDGVPTVFADCLNQPAFIVADTTFCVWWLNDDPGWRCGDVRFPADHPDPDGSELLLSQLDGRPETYREFARGYFSAAKKLSLGAVRHVFKHRPLTEEFVRSINPKATLSGLEADLREIGYPAAGDWC
jgi:hypothetical protein